MSLPADSRSLWSSLRPEDDRSRAGIVSPLGCHRQVDRENMNKTNSFHFLYVSLFFCHWRSGFLLIGFTFSDTPSFLCHHYPSIPLVFLRLLFAHLYLPRSVVYSDVHLLTQHVCSSAFTSSGFHSLKQFL